jgi:uncharacterized membrane protein YphA (DoxX/SURF4 family)
VATPGRKARRRKASALPPVRGLFLAARVLIPSAFVGLGLERLLVAAGIVAGVPASAGTVVFSAFELMAGLLVMVGWKVRWVAGLLALFILVDAFLAHAFWAYPAAERRCRSVVQRLRGVRELSSDPATLHCPAWKAKQLPTWRRSGRTGSGSAPMRVSCWRL